MKGVMRMGKKNSENTKPEKLDTKGIKKIGDVIGEDGANFYEDRPRIDWKALIDTEIVLKDAKILVGFKSAKYGIHDCALMLVETMTGEEFTTISSGEVIVSKCRRLIESGGFPVIATVTNAKYYNLV